MRSVRLPEDLEKELEMLADQKNVSRSNIIKEALVEYMAKEKKYNKPYEAGAAYFGKHGSGEANRSVTYKSRIKDKIRDKHND
ncbi:MULTISPECIES: CopG family ribbon-helix-helix protein [Gracilimonas]|uniref:Ribbon-helix-helix domain-containing protein n=1 Tax=Gracilimonas sediminicola TaxID=2952158 RepID=A0A9X2RHT6_9BACT|nr:CopG family transcriptional regulator [Gracilimonas sediminicola]MCP9292169.1 ribbon-helix-helix domain-containing protein [Gracilimonas sediminicola]